MEIAGWIVRTGEPGGVRYWKVGTPDLQRAVAIVAEISGAQTVKALERIGVWAASRPTSTFFLDSSAAIEIWGREADLRPQALWSPKAVWLPWSEDRAQISFDTILKEDDNENSEGCYRVNAGDWKVFYFTHNRTRARTDRRSIHHDVPFSSGILGTDGFLPRWEKLSKQSIIDILAKQTGVIDWVEVRGPDSLILK